MEHTVRRLKKDETGILEDLLYAAIFLPEGVEPPPRDIINAPELQVYIKDFGEQPDDYCLVAETGGRIIGGVWVRIMDDYGHVDDRTPSLAIAVFDGYRGRGIGTELMKEMICLLRSEGYRQLSLSVQKENPACRLYERLGFRTVAETGEEYIMVCSL